MSSATAVGRSRVVLWAAAGLAVLVLGLGAAAAGAWWWWGRPAPAAPPPGPPDVSLTGADPVVAAAVQGAQDWVRREPKSANAWGGLGGVLLANDFAAQADVCLARAEQLDPKEARWPYLRAWGLLTRDREAAIAALRRAVDRSDPADANGVVIRLRLADTLLTVGANEEAGGLYRTVLEHDPSNIRAHFGAGMVAAALDDVNTAVEHLRPCADSPYARNKACVALAPLYQRRGQSAQADEVLRLAAQGPPRDRDWDDPYLAENAQLGVGRQKRFIEGEQLQRAGLLREAAAQFRALLQDYPDDSHSYVKLGMVRDQLGDYAGAEQVLREAARRAPDESQAYYFLSVSLYHQAEALGRPPPPEAVALYQDAAEQARTATKLKSDHAFAHLYLGLSLKALGRLDEAIASMQKAVTFSTDSVDPHLHLGEALAESGQVKKGLDELQRAANLAGPDDARPREALRRWSEAPRKPE